MILKYVFMKSIVEGVKKHAVICLQFITRHFQASLYVMFTIGDSCAINTVQCISYTTQCYSMFLPPGLEDSAYIRNLIVHYGKVISSSPEDQIITSVCVTFKCIVAI